MELNSASTKAVNEKWKKSNRRVKRHRKHKMKKKYMCTIKTEKKPENRGQKCENYRVKSKQRKQIKKGNTQ